MNLKQIVKNNRQLFYFFRDIIGLPSKFYMFVRNHGQGTSSKVVFTSFAGTQYSDNPRAISEALHSMFPDIEIVWLIKENKRKGVPDYIKCVDYTKHNMLRELSTAKVWIDNSFTYAYACNSIYKNRNQLYIQTWHGDRGFKKCGYEWKGFTSDTRGIENGLCDYILVGSNFEKDFFRKGYRYKGDFLVTGSPRDDILVKPNKQRCIQARAELSLELDTNILLYAPTLRDDNDNSGIEEFMRGIDSLLLACQNYKPGKWVCLLRGHHLSRVDMNQNRDSCIDASNYPDMSDLLAISDILITDYSSSAGDFILQARPVILFQPDRRVFTENDRQLLFDVDDSPFIVAKTYDELISVICSLGSIDIKNNCRKILEMYQAYEPGDASEKVANIIGSFIQGERL